MGDFEVRALGDALAGYTREGAALTLSFQGVVPHLWRPPDYPARRAAHVTRATPLAP
jgi:hypothetical protein